jgi:hypothetical protein
MTNEINELRQMSVPPSDSASFDGWLKMQDAVKFLKENAQDEQFMLYANMPNIYMHAVLVPSAFVEPPNVDDLMLWHCDAYSCWSVFTAPPSVGISPPLDGTGSATLDKGEQLIFARSFQGRIGEPHYIEILQKFHHISDLHFLAERNAYCRFDAHGDIEEVIRIVEIPAAKAMFGGTIVTVRREVLDRYVTLTDSAIVRTFDFTRARLDRFSGWRNAFDEEVTNEGDLFYRTHIEPGNACSMRGCQILRSQASKEAIVEEFHPGSISNQQHASFIAHDWKNQVVKEISCAPGQTVNYFTESHLPFELSPAFFRPEVLSKYKADSEKYRMDERSISCRATWSLQNYDVNEAGQVHTYLVYLRRLPYEEQLHWKAHNEAPKGTISRRAYLRDFEGSWEELYDPLESLKEHVRKLHDDQVPWWTLRSEDSIDRLHYPVTASPDEWANEILHLDQLIVEPFEKAWFKKDAHRLGKAPDPMFGSLVLAEVCLSRRGFSEDDAKALVAPLRILHELRTKLKGHAIAKSSLAEIKQRALTEHGTYNEHFRVFCKACDKSLREIAEALRMGQATPAQ